MSETESYILNAVQTPAPMETVYRSIERGNTTKDELVEDTALDESLLNQGITGLLSVGLVGRQEPDYYTVDLPWETGDGRLDFRLAVLHGVATDAQPENWGKQSVVLLNYQYLLQENVQSFRSDDGALYTEMNRWERDRGYRPRSQQGVIDLNAPKFTNWTRLARFLGLLHKASGRHFTTYPDEYLLEATIRLATRELDADPLGIEEYVDWLRENVLLVELTGDRNVPAPLSRVLFNLVRRDRIRIVESGDVGAVGLNGVPTNVQGIDAAANAIELRQ